MNLCVTTNIHILLVYADGTVVIYPEQNNTLICPGESLHYSCDTSRHNSITWSIQCPGASPRRLSLSSTNSEENISCNDIFHLDIHFIYKSTQSRRYSNITIDLPYLNYSVAKAHQSVKIGCGEGESEDSIIYFYVEIAGVIHFLSQIFGGRWCIWGEGSFPPNWMNLVHSFILSAGFPPFPSNLSYSYGVCNGTHFLTTFNWSNPMESRRSLVESYVLTLTSTDNISRSVVNSNTTSITIPLNYQNMLVYTATVHSSSCGEVLESKNNPSINVTFTQCM